jgi:hypothetical protein
MDWACSAGLFFDHLLQVDGGAYASGQKQPWQYVQDVQDSATADGSNYQAQWSKAVSLYNTVSTIQQEGFLMALTDQEQADVHTWLGDIHGGLFNPIQSQSPFRALGEGAVWQQHQLPINDDGFIHPQYVEWAAGSGDPASLAILETLAAANPANYPDRVQDIKLAQQVLARVSGGSVTPPVVTPPAPQPIPVPNVVPPVTPTPAPAPAQPGINISATQLLSWAKDAVTVLGALGTWATAIHGVLGQFLPGTSGVVVPSVLAAATTVSATHTVHKQRQAEKQAAMWQTTVAKLAK